MEDRHRAMYLSSAVVAVFSLFVAISGFGRSYVGGVLYTRDGRRVEVAQFLDPLKKDDRIHGESAGKNVLVSIGDLKEINLLTADVNYVFPHSKLVQETGTVSLVYRDGRAAILTNAYFERGTLSFVVMNEKRQREEKKVKIRDLAKIQFEATVGTVRICPIDKAVFPDDFMFCPHHGVPLIWGSPKP